MTTQRVTYCPRALRHILTRHTSTFRASIGVLLGFHSRKNPFILIVPLMPCVVRTSHPTPGDFRSLSLKGGGPAVAVCSSSARCAPKSIKKINQNATTGRGRMGLTHNCLPCQVVSWHVTYPRGTVAPNLDSTPGVVGNIVPFLLLLLLLLSRICGWVDASPRTHQLCAASRISCQLRRCAFTRTRNYCCVLRLPLSGLRVWQNKSEEPEGRRAKPHVSPHLFYGFFAVLASFTLSYESGSEISRFAWVAVRPIGRIDRREVASQVSLGEGSLERPAGARAYSMISMIGPGNTSFPLVWFTDSARNFCVRLLLNLTPTLCLVVVQSRENRATS
ncbi:hypothetical protein BJV78DRAFT_226584 [Lactifluus subvellereus]|nr:hypothetical protein BJV78DRAFT_226584 [Lactifluus subvellereus]